jgi:hypothetical protein
MPPFCWRSCAGVITALLLSALAGLAAAADEASAARFEAPVRAAFLYHFARFVEWPAEPAGRPPRDFTIGILGQDPFGPSLETAVAGKTVGGRPLVVLRTASVEAARRCEIVFVGLEGEELARALDGLRGAPVLTVGDTDGFVQRGGMVSLARDENHVRLRINSDAARAAGLKVSSRLLSLARISRSAEASR